MALTMSLLGLEMSVLKTTFSDFSISNYSTSYSFTIINEHIVCTEKISRYFKIASCIIVFCAFMPPGNTNIS